MPTIQEVDAWEGQDAYGPDTEKIGEIAHVYLDQDTGRAEWVTVKTGMLGHLSFVPLSEARADGDHIQLSYDKDTVKDAPKVNPNDELSGDEVVELYRFYGVDWYESPADQSGLHGEHNGVAERDIDGHENGYATTRSQEHLEADPAEREGGRGRLRRHLAPEPAMPAQRDGYHTEPAPITDADRDRAMGRDPRMDHAAPVSGAGAHRL